MQLIHVSGDDAGDISLKASNSLGEQDNPVTAALQATIENDAKRAAGEESRKASETLGALRGIDLWRNWHPHSAGSQKGVFLHGDALTTICYAF